MRSTPGLSPCWWGDSFLQEVLSCVWWIIPETIAFSAWEWKQPWALGKLITRKTCSGPGPGTPSPGLGFSISERPAMGLDAQPPSAVTLLNCCFPPKLNDPVCFCWYRVAWPQARCGEWCRLEVVLFVEMTTVWAGSSWAPLKSGTSKGTKQLQGLGLVFLFYSI